LNFIIIIDNHCWLLWLIVGLTITTLFRLQTVIYNKFITSSCTKNQQDLMSKA